jgi:hypothetical protein
MMGQHLLRLVYAFTLYTHVCDVSASSCVCVCCPWTTMTLLLSHSAACRVRLAGANTMSHNAYGVMLNKSLLCWRCVASCTEHFADAIVLMEALNACVELAAPQADCVLQCAVTLATARCGVKSLEVPHVVHQMC